MEQQILANRTDAVGAFRRHVRTHRLSVARAVHEPTRSESEGERRRKRRGRPDFDAPPFCREARRHGQNVKGRKIDVATVFFAGALPRIRGKASKP